MNDAELVELLIDLANDIKRTADNVQEILRHMDKPQKSFHVLPPFDWDGEIDDM